MSRVDKTLTDFRDQNDEELRALLATTRDDLFRLQLGQHTNQVTSTADLVNKRRDIARILTILRARELGHEKQAEKKTEGETAPAAEETKKKTKKAKS